MKVLHVHRAYLPYQGGSARRISSLLEAGNSIPGYEQHVLVTRDGVGPDAPDEEVIGGIRVFRLDDWRRIPLRARALHRAHRYDAVHFHNPRDFFFAAPLLRGLPAVLESHGITEKSWLRRRLAGAAFRRARGVIVLSEAARAWLAREEGVDAARIRAIPNGVDATLFTPAAGDVPPELPPSGGKRIGYVGTMYDWQGIFALVDAMPHALAIDPEVSLLLVGDGPHAARLRARIDELGISDRVHLRGFVPAAEVNGWLQAVDLFAMVRPPSLQTELTTPLKIFEVALAGRPLLVSARAALLEPAGERPEEMLWVQDDLSPEALGARLAALVSPERAGERAQRAERFRAHVLAQDSSWEHRARDQHRLHRAVVAGAVPAAFQAAEEAAR